MSGRVRIDLWRGGSRHHWEVRSHRITSNHWRWADKTQFRHLSNPRFIQPKSRRRQNSVCGRACSPDSQTLVRAFRYKTYASTYLQAAKKFTCIPIKQAVISPSALSLLYPSEAIANYPQEKFLEDLVKEAAADIRGCLEQGAHCVQIDFTEGRLAVKLDPSGQLLSSFIALINRVLAQFREEERKRIGVHTCPGGDRDSTHSADVDYSGLLPSLFSLDVGSFYMQLASEPDRRRVLRIVRENLRPSKRVFVGVIDPINPRVETPQEVRDRVLEAADFIPLVQLGTTDDCGFSPFGDDLSTARETAFAKIRARVEGTRLAAEQQGWGMSASRLSVQYATKPIDEEKPLSEIVFRTD
jgi:5-methyltetrahydropteroyltriglutamate--homocysteine methyltransferase